MEAERTPVVCSSCKATMMVPVPTNELINRPNALMIVAIPTRATCICGREYAPILTPQTNLHYQWVPVTKEAESLAKAAAARTN